MENQAAPKEILAPSLKDLFLGFAKIGILGFGGVGAIAHHIIVEERKWLDDKDYATVLGIGQVLPGANTVNIGVIIGDRYQGKLGSLACVLGLMLIPTIVIILLAIAYDHFSSIPQVRIALIGASAAAAGMILGTGLKMFSKLKTQLSDYLIITLTIIIITLLHLPVISSLAALIPASVLITWRLRK